MKKPLWKEGRRVKGGCRNEEISVYYENFKVFRAAELAALKAYLWELDNEAEDDSITAGIVFSIVEERMNLVKKAELFEELPNHYKISNL